MKPQTRFAAVVASALAALGVSLDSEANGAATAPFRHYSVADGLSQSEVYDLVQDDAGYLWFTTGRGLNRFDGREFEHWTIADSLPTNDLTALAIGPNNELWVGDSHGGLSLLRGGRVVRTFAPLTERSFPIADLLLDGGRVLAIAEGLGILQIDETTSAFSLLSNDDVSPQRFVTVENDVWVLGAAGLYRLHAGSKIGRAVDIPGIRAIAVEDGAVWAADAQGRVGQLRGGAFVPQSESLTDAPILNIATDAGATVYVATAEEIITLKPVDGNFVVTQRHAGFNSIKRLLVDREQTLWLSTESGLIRAFGDRFAHFQLRTSDEPQMVWSITEDSQRAFWFGTQRGLLRKTDDALDVIGPQAGVPLGRVRDIVRDADGVLWAGLRGDGLYRIDATQLRGEPVAGTEGLEILDVAVADDGTLWFGTFASGVFRYEPSEKQLETYAAPEGAPVFTLDVADDGSVWFGADDVGLVRLERSADGESRQQLFAREQGLARNLFNQIHWVAADEVWIGMEEGAVYRFDGNRFEDLGVERPFSDQSVYILELLANGDLLAGGEQGLYQFQENGRTVHYGRLSGFIGSELSVHASYFDADGHLWLGTIDGATRMDVAQPLPPTADLAPRITRIETLTGGALVGQGAELAAKERGVRIQYAAVSLRSPQHLEFSYKLSGLDTVWSAPTRDRGVTYSNVPAGSYEFKVRARFPGDRWHEIESPQRFSMAPYFWQHPVTVAASIVAAVLGIAALLASRTRSIRRSNETLKIQVAERTASIEKAKERLQQSFEELSREAEERRKSDQARAELETRFHRAFRHAPIGMGLLNGGGELFDANPALQKMLWPTLEEVPAVEFSSMLEEKDRERFGTLFAESVASLTEHVEGKFTCIDSANSVLNVEVNLSTVHSEDAGYLYSVLQVLDVTESLKLTGRLEYQAMYDELTGLLNRRAFESELARAWEFGRGNESQSFLLYMDLDQFKVVNDTSGHAAGDELLKRVSKILIESVRSNDSVGRLGGDEFAIILWKCPMEVAERIAENIRSTIERLRFQWDTETYRIGVSIGGVPIDARIGDTGELQQLADAACYTAKEDGRNRVHIVKGDQDSARLHRGQVRWVQRLREAMDNDRFTIYGQVVRPADDSVVEMENFEILLRLRDPETRKLVPPGAFLPAAERYGFSLELDEWVVRNLLKALFVYQSFQADPCRYWINLSASSIGDERFATFLKEELSRSPLPPGTVNFEITERAVIRNIGEAEGLMSELRDMGCRFALDDIGSGLSSFGYLKKLPIDYLKVGGVLMRDVVTDHTSRVIIKSIVDIAHTMGIETVCDRIENEEMLEVVRTLGTDHVQGFAIGKPFVLTPNFDNIVAGQRQQQAG